MSCYDHSVTGTRSNNSFGSITSRVNKLKQFKKKYMEELMSKESGIIGSRDTRYSADTTQNSASAQKASSTQTSSSGSGSVGQLLDTISSLLDNNAGNSTTVASPKSSSNSSSRNSGGSSVSGGSSGSSGGVSWDDIGASYSGYAEGLSNTSGTLGVDSNNISSMRATVNSGDTSSLTALKPQLSAEKAKMNETLASVQADYSVLQNQKQTAESNIEDLESTVDTIGQERDDANTALQNNKSSLNSSIEARDAMDEQLSAVNNQYTKDCENVKTQEQSKTKAQSEVSDAKSSKAKADSAVSTASQNLQAAESALSSTPETLEDGKPNPQYEAAKAKVEEAKKNYEEAQKAQKEAENTLNTAQQKLTEAEQSLSDAQSAKKATLKSLQQTDSNCKELANKCEKMEEHVETSQENYDESVQTYDETNANYERYNSELEAQQGILSQYQAVETRLNEVKNMSSEVNQLEKDLDKKLASQKNGLSETEKKTVGDDLLQNAYASEGCSASKTPLENLISSKDYDLSQCKGNVWEPGLASITATSEELSAQGYIKNSDGSFTDPRTGVTMVNALQDDKNWVQSCYTGVSLSFTGSAGTNLSDVQNLIGRDYPGAVDAAARAKEQERSGISLNGFDENGRAKLRWR